MSFKTAPVPKDVQELLFKQSSIHQISENFTSVPTNCNLVAADGKRGLLYVGHKNRISVLQLGNEANIEWKIDLELPDIISRLSLNCDFSYLAVTLSAPAVLIYSAASLSKNVLDLLHEIRLSTSSGDIIVSDLCWNPAVPGMLCTVTSDTIGSFQVKGDRKAGVGITALERIPGLEALCLAWSPKGKQIVVGCRNGNIIQLKPDLKPARTIPGPNPNIGVVKAILWVSNYQFCAAYQEPGEQKINVLIVDAPKGESTAIFTNYEDITYGGVPTTRFYFESIPEWGVIFAASSSSSEIAVLGSIDNGNSWEQWQLVDSGRAELPLVRTDESFPVGLAIDRSADRKLVWSPETTLPNPVPIIHILGTSGQLCSFHIVNLKNDCPAICIPPSEIVTPPQVQAPCIPAPRPSISSSEISFDLATGATSTPRPKADSPKEKPKNMLSNLVQESTRPPVSAPRPEPANPPVSLPVIETKIPSFVQQPDPKPTNNFPQVEIKIPKPRIEKVETQEKIPVYLPERKDIPKEAQIQEKPSIDEGLCLRAYREEEANFEKELKTRLEPLTWECGTNSERQQLIEKTALIDEFFRDLQETTTSLSSDVAYLKALLLQSFAWLEESKSKNSKSVKLSTRGRSNSKLSELQRFFYYTQSQLVQASQVLDLEWSEQQSKERNKLKIPNMEFIYQSLMRHGQILGKEKSNLENLVRKWKSVRSGTVSINRSLSNLHITNFGNDSAIDLRCKAIAGKRESFSREKQNRLRDLLSENPPRIIRANKPTLIQDRLEATLTNLALSSPAKISKPKEVNQKPKVSSPLASLNNIVSKIGTPGKEPDRNLQKIVPTFAAKSPAFNISSLVAQKPKIQQNQQVQQIQQSQPIQQSQQAHQSQPVSSSVKPFSKVDSIPFGQRTEESLPKEVTKIEKPKGTLQPPGVPNSISGTLQANVSTPRVSSTFSLQSSVSLPSTAAQSFSFASKTPTSLSTFSVKPEEEKKSLDLGGSNLSLQSSGLSINLIPESKPVSTSQSANSVPQSAISSVNFGKAVPTPSAAFGQASSATNSFGNGGSIFGKNINQGSIFGNQGSIFGGSSNLKTTFASTTVASSGIFTSTVPTSSVPTSVSLLSSSLSSPSPLSSSSLAGPAPFSTSSLPSPAPLSSPSLPSPAPLSSLVSSKASVISPPLTSTPVPSPISSPTLVSSPSVPVTSPPAYGSIPVSSPTTSGSDISQILGSPKPSSPTSIFSTPFGTSKPGSPASSLNFGTAISITPVFGKEPTSTPGSIFGGSTISTSNVFGGTTSSPSANPFGGNTLAQSTPNSSIFGGTTSPPGSIFGGTTSAPAFGVKTPPGSSVFGMSSQNPVFGAPASTSVFGGGAKPQAQETNFSIFGGTTSAFGQAPAFGTKPAFGGSPDFGQKPAFGTGFGGTAAFGGSPASPGFGSPPIMGASPPPLSTSPMQKVFGGSSGSNTFESLATQSGGLSFGSLAQSSPEQQQQQQQSPPEFTAKSSFSSWR